MTPLYIIQPNVLFTCTGYFLKIFPHYITGQKFGIFNFNPSKTAVMTISNQRNINPPLFFNNIHLSETDTHKHLGVIFHHSLSWHTHILHLHQKVMTKINRLRSFSNSLPRHSLLTIYKTKKLPTLTMEAIFMTTAPIATNICWMGPNSLPLKSLDVGSCVAKCVACGKW